MFKETFRTVLLPITYYLLPIAVYLLPFAFTSCEDEVSSQYSTQYQVRFFMNVNESAELISAIGNPGQFVTIRQKAGKVRIENELGGNDYNLSYIGANEFLYGLGGLIVGTSNIPNMNGNFDIVAYDLACPTCNRAERRLSVHGGNAKCGKCGLSYDLNNNGVISNSADSTLTNVRGLYKYRLIYDGKSINVFN